MSSISLWMTNHTKGHGQGHVTHLKFLQPSNISGTAETSQILYTGAIYQVLSLV